MAGAPGLEPGTYGFGGRVKDLKPKGALSNQAEIHPIGINELGRFFQLP